MRAVQQALCALALIAAAAAEPADEQPRSAFAPGRVSRATSGWHVSIPDAAFFVRDADVRDAPEALAPVAALFRARSVDKRAWGWVILTRHGRVDVFEELDGFTVTTPRESFRVIRRSSRDYILAPGRPGIRRISIEEYIDTIQDTKKNPPRR